MNEDVAACATTATCAWVHRCVASSTSRAVGEHLAGRRDVIWLAAPVRYRRRRSRRADDDGARIDRKPSRRFRLGFQARVYVINTAVAAGACRNFAGSTDTARPPPEPLAPREQSARAQLASGVRRCTALLCRRGGCITVAASSAAGTGVAVDGASTRGGNRAHVNRPFTSMSPCDNSASGREPVALIVTPASSTNVLNVNTAI